MNFGTHKKRIVNPTKNTKMIKDKWNILKLCLEVEDDKVGQLSLGYFWRMKFVAVKMRMADAGKFSRSYFGSIILPFFRSTKEEKAIKLWCQNLINWDCVSPFLSFKHVFIFLRRFNHYQYLISFKKPHYPGPWPSHLYIRPKAF